jgi:NAD(P)-dependent dehydrogenase (short-subunit alcohol dehydrogenase family)
MNLTDKVALVTGAGSGIGRAVAVRLAAAGAKVIVADFNEDAGARTCAELKKSGAEAAWRLTDVSKNDEVQELVAFTTRTFGRLDCAVK